MCMCKIRKIHTFVGCEHCPHFFSIGRCCLCKGKR